MKEFKITEKQMQDIVNVLLEVQGKYSLVIVDILRSLKEIQKEDNE